MRFYSAKWLFLIDMYFTEDDAVAMFAREIQKESEMA